MIRVLKPQKIVFFFFPGLAIYFSFWTFLKCPFFKSGCPMPKKSEKTRFTGRCSKFLLYDENICDDNFFLCLYLQGKGFRHFFV
jgi:hypothetical protein